MTKDEISTKIKSVFHVNNQASVLIDVLWDIMGQPKDKPEEPEEPKLTHADYRMHKPKVCGKYGRMAKDSTCECEGFVSQKKKS
jgi:hypothetical protein